VCGNGKHDVGERPLGFKGFRSHPVYGAIHRGSSDAEEFGEFALGVVP